MLSEAELTRRGGLVLEALDNLTATDAFAVVSWAVRELAEHEGPQEKAENTSLAISLEGPVRSKIEQDSEVRHFIHSLRGSRSYKRIAEDCRKQFGDRAPSSSAIGRYVLRLKRRRGAGGQHNV